MERYSGNKENIFSRFARKTAGKYIGLILLAGSAVETERTVVDLADNNKQDAKISSAVGTAELSLGTAIFIARKTNRPKEPTANPQQ